MANANSPIKAFLRRGRFLSGGRSLVASLLLFTSTVTWAVPSCAAPNLGRETLRPLEMEQSPPDRHRLVQSLAAAGMEENVLFHEAVDLVWQRVKQGLVQSLRRGSVTLAGKNLTKARIGTEAREVAEKHGGWLRVEFDGSVATLLPPVPAGAEEEFQKIKEKFEKDYAKEIGVVRKAEKGKPDPYWGDVLWHAWSAMRLAARHAHEIHALYSDPRKKAPPEVEKQRDRLHMLLRDKILPVLEAAYQAHFKEKGQEVSLTLRSDPQVIPGDPLWIDPFGRPVFTQEVELLAGGGRIRGVLEVSEGGRGSKVVRRILFETPSSYLKRAGGGWSVPSKTSKDRGLIRHLDSLGARTHSGTEANRLLQQHHSAEAMKKGTQTEIPAAGPAASAASPLPPALSAAGMEGLFTLSPGGGPPSFSIIRRRWWNLPQRQEGQVAVEEPGVVRFLSERLRRPAEEVRAGLKLAEGITPDRPFAEKQEVEELVKEIRLFLQKSGLDPMPGADKLPLEKLQRLADEIVQKVDPHEPLLSVQGPLAVAVEYALALLQEGAADARVTAALCDTYGLSAGAEEQGPKMLTPPEGVPLREIAALVRVQLEAEKGAVLFRYLFPEKGIGPDWDPGRGVFPLWNRAEVRLSAGTLYPALPDALRQTAAAFEDSFLGPEVSRFRLTLLREDHPDWGAETIIQMTPNLDGVIRSGVARLESLELPVSDFPEEGLRQGRYGEVALWASAKTAGPGFSSGEAVLLLNQIFHHAFLLQQLTAAGAEERSVTLAQLQKFSSWRELFGNDRPVAWEIGPGNGEALYWRAVEEPGLNFLGVVMSSEAPRGYRDYPFPSNVKFVLQADVRELIKALSPQMRSLRKILIDFPPPSGPYAYLSDPGTLRALLLALEPGGELAVRTESDEVVETLRGGAEAVGGSGSIRAVSAVRHEGLPDTVWSARYEDRGIRTALVTYARPSAGLEEPSVSIEEIPALLQFPPGSVRHRQVHIFDPENADVGRLAAALIADPVVIIARDARQEDLLLKSGFSGEGRYLARLDTFAGIGDARRIVARDFASYDPWYYTAGERKNLLVWLAGLLERYNIPDSILSLDGAQDKLKALEILRAA